MLKNFLGISLILATLSTCAKQAQTADNEEVECGGYSKFRQLTAEDSLAFRSAVKDDAGLKPVLVSSQIVAGMNYRFRCLQMNADSTYSPVEVKIFQPLEGEGEPEVISIVDIDERLLN